MNSRIYEGRVRHRRFHPVENEFTYSMFMLYLDLDEVPGIFRDRWLWSADRPALAWFRRRDHFGDPRVSLDVAVRDLVEERTDRRPEGPIRLLTHLRYFGYCFNPASFYYCFDGDGELETIVTEITNTPWGERHRYVHDEESNLGAEKWKRFRFRKDFHVSPFMGMDQSYDWRFRTPDRRLVTHMETFEAGRRMLG
ncbi:MAG: DUF1365 domain-containing protein, partial [Planctomycetota bacterium]